MSIGQLQHIQPFENNDVGLFYLVHRARNNVIVKVRVDRRRGAPRAGFDIRQKAQQQPLIVAFGKAFAVHEPALFEHAIREQKTIRSDQVHARMIGPARQTRAQHARESAFADRNAPGDADNIRNFFRRRCAHKLVPGLVEMLNRRHMQVQQARKRNVNIFDFDQRDLFVDASQGDEFRFGEKQRRVGAESAPLPASEVNVAADGRRRRAKSQIQAGLGVAERTGRLLAAVRGLNAAMPILALGLVFACFAFCAEKSLAVVDASVSASEDGPRIASDYAFLPGDYVYFTFRIAGFTVKSEDRDEIQKISLSYEVAPQDQSGTSLAEAVAGKIVTDLSPEDKDWLPKRRVSFLLPSFVASGEYRLHVLVKDAFGNTAAPADFPFHIGGANIQPSPALNVQNFEFLRRESDRQALAVPAYSPGDTVSARFELVGYKLAPGNAYHLTYGLIVLRPNGKPFFQQPKAADLANNSFYPAPFVPGTLNLTTSNDTPHGEYVIVLTVRDLIGDQTYETRHAFSIE